MRVILGILKPDVETLSDEEQFSVDPTSTLAMNIEIYERFICTHPMHLHGHSYLSLVARVLNKEYRQPKKRLGFRR